MSFLEVKKIYKSFGKTEVLKGIDFSMEKGEVLAIIGSSGSGKTTLLRCMNFLETPDTGTISVNGNVLFSSDEPPYSDAEKREKRLHFGLVFQQFNLFPQYNVLKNVSLAPELRQLKAKKVTKAEKKEIIRQIDDNSRRLLDTVGLSEKVNNYPCELSGGQQQRVAIARSLAMDPVCMLFDEPTSALDPEMINEVLDVMIGLAKEGMTMMVVTHEMGFARKVANRVLFMDAGEIVEQAPAEEFFTKPRSDRAQKFLAKILQH